MIRRRRGFGIDVRLRQCDPVRCRVLHGSQDVPERIRPTGDRGGGGRFGGDLGMYRSDREGGWQFLLLLLEGDFPADSLRNVRAKPKYTPNRHAQAITRQEYPG
jgi:hypothetical protein